LAQALEALPLLRSAAAAWAEAEQQLQGQLGCVPGDCLVLLRHR
jgi:hypothetical protein